MNVDPLSLLAAFWDPGNDAFDIGDLGIVISIIGGVIAVLVIGLRWLDRKIDERTHQIQPETNGGKSLSDLHKKVDQFAEYQRAVNEARDQSIELIIGQIKAQAKAQQEQADLHRKHLQDHQDMERK